MTPDPNGVVWSRDSIHIPFSLPVRISTVSAGDLGPSGGPNPLRNRWLELHGFDPARTVLRTQVHSRRIVTPGPVIDFEDRADGTASVDPALALAVTVADCMPIAVWDPAVGAFAMLHSGWKGTGILAAALELFSARWGSDLRSVEVVLGPCIGSCCYPVDQERAGEYRAEWGEESVVRADDGSVRLDLRAANRSILRRYGIDRITDVPLCTSCMGELGSYRRQGKERFVRMLAVIGGPAHHEAERSTSHEGQQKYQSW